MSSQQISIERWLDEEIVEEFLTVYRAAFAPLEPLAAGRQSLTDEEFREEMADPSVLKFVGRDEHDDVVALSFVATDLATVPWISPAFFATRFPEHYDRGAIWYFGALLVRPENQGGPWVTNLTNEMVTEVVANRGIAAFDCCTFNVEQMGVPQFVEAAGRRVAEVEYLEVDAQRYYAYVAKGFQDHVDLRDRREDVIDLRDPKHAQDEHERVSP